MVTTNSNDPGRPQTPTPSADLISCRHLDSLLQENSPLSADSKAVLRSMLDAGSIGPRKAVTQSRLARLSGVSRRQIQRANIELLLAGVVICSSCGGQAADGSAMRPGQFIARDPGDVAPFRDQLSGRAKLCFVHVQLLDSAVRIAQSESAQDRSGAGTLFAEATP